MKVGILGASGFVGKNLCDVIPYEYIGASSRTGVDARVIGDIISWINDYEITHIVNLAAECGGIGRNQIEPAHLWYSTTLIMANVLEAARITNILKVVNVGTVCMYAKNCVTPFKEEYLLHYGPMEETNLAYGMSKLNAMYGAAAYQKQYGLAVDNLIPVNMYGLYDNFDLETSHVIPALINKIDAAILNSSPAIEVWGTGNASREFLYVTDFCNAICKCFEYDTGGEFLNIGTGAEILIRDLVEMLCDIMGYKGDITYNSSKPDGQPRRCLDISKARSIIGYEPTVNLRDGLEKTVSWYRNGG